MSEKTFRPMLTYSDECHRSQFGEMHKKITKFFKHYYLFGFTGTPIFAENAQKKGNPNFATTPQLFGGSVNQKTGKPGSPLHTYTIVNAINDENVLPFRIDYVDTMHMKDRKDKQVQAIDRESALSSPERIQEIVAYVLEHYDQKTKRTSSYDLKGKRVSGFNSIFAAQSIPVAIMYYREFKKQIAEKKKNLRVATIYSFAANEEDDELSDILPDEEFETEGMDASSRDALESAIMDYNLIFHTNYDTSSAKFQNYYKDLSQQVKNREIDILIVVNMFLTGFDATTLNTLWVDKNLKMHGLIQAFSRTNRILNSVKNYGNIVCFRNLEDQVDEAIALFGDADANSIVLLKDYEADTKRIMGSIIRAIRIWSRCFFPGFRLECQSKGSRIRRILSACTALCCVSPISCLPLTSLQARSCSLIETCRIISLNTLTCMINSVNMWTKRTSAMTLSLRLNW